MKPVFTLIVFCIVISSSGRAQSIPVPFQKLEPQRPFLFQDKAGDRLVWLFYPERSRASRKYPCNAVETDTLAREIRRTGPAGYVEEREELVNETPFRQVCSHASGGHFYGVVVNGHYYQCLKVNGADLSVNSRQLVKLSDKQRYLTAATLGDKSVLMTTEKRRKEADALHVYVFEGDSVARHQVFDLDQTSSVLADKGFNPVVAQDLLELSPNRAAANRRVFVEGQRIQITEDVQPGYSTEGYVSIFTVDIAAMTFTSNQVPYGLERKSTEDRAKTASCIFEEKLFQVYAHEDFLQVTVRDMDTYKVLWQKSFAKDAPLDFLNTPVTTPSAWQGDKAVTKTSKLCKLLSWADPFIFVRHTADGYLIHLGGYRLEEGEAVAVGALFGLVGAAILTASGWTGEKMVSTYMLLDDRDFSRKDKFYPQTLLQRCGDRMSELRIQDKDRAQGLFQMGQNFYLGRFIVKDRVYELSNIGNL
ncbi:MAG: hypothetical protein KA165_04015 [Saprospiraceae bacterium]|nr:hypothetical protein [Saprospiraceae bacterium]